MKRIEIGIAPINIIIYGHRVQIAIVATTHVRVWDDPEIATRIDMTPIVQALRNDDLRGELEGDLYIPTGIPCEGTIVRYTALWHRTFDYRQFLSLFQWWWCHSYAQALTEQDFQSAFGKRMGEHYFEKWRSYDRSIPRMISYFGSEMNCGQTFLDMVSQMVYRYETYMK